MLETLGSEEVPEGVFKEMAKLFGPLRNLLNLDPEDVYYYHDGSNAPFENYRHYEFVEDLIHKMKPIHKEAK